MTCILVVEDEDDMRDVLTEVLQEAGFDVRALAAADDAVSLLNDEGLRLIVTDIMLPGRLDGIDLALAADATCPEMPVIIISGQPAMLEKAQAVCTHATCLKKPFALKNFVEEVERLGRASVCQGLL